MTKHSPLTSISATRAVVDAFGLSTKKELGQHFLINDGIVSRICSLSELDKSDVIMEIGPGIGTLTLALLREAGLVVAIERDRDLIPVLHETCSAYFDKFALINKDALSITEEDLQKALSGLSANTDANFSFLPTKLVANLPYAVAATLVLDCFEQLPSLTSATIMVQSEVADRMAARPNTKDYGAYTVKLHLYARPVSRFKVGPQNFFPPPHVDSAVIRLDRSIPKDRSGCAINERTRAAAALMADAAFATRRKTISNSCKVFFSRDKVRGERIIEALPAIFEETGIDPRVRGESLVLEDFIELGRGALSVF